MELPPEDNYPHLSTIKFVEAPVKLQPEQCYQLTEAEFYLKNPLFGKEGSNEKFIGYGTHILYHEEIVMRMKTPKLMISF